MHTLFIIFCSQFFCSLYCFRLVHARASAAKFIFFLSFLLSFFFFPSSPPYVIYNFSIFRLTAHTRTPTNFPNFPKNQTQTPDLFVTFFQCVLFPEISSIFITFFPIRQKNLGREGVGKGNWKSGRWDSVYRKEG